MHNTDTIRYKLLSPLHQSKNKAERYPLLIYFHGANERGKDNIKQTRHIDHLMKDTVFRNTFPCYVLAPQCPPNMMWADLDWKRKVHVRAVYPTLIMDLTGELLDTILKHYPIDTTRIYVTGVSMGGFGAFDFTTRHPNRVAAATVVCGGYDTSAAHILSAIPIWMFHGSLDRLVHTDNSRYMFKALQAAGSKKAAYTELKNVKHAAWLTAYGSYEIFKWMFANHKDLPVDQKKTGLDKIETGNKKHTSKEN